MQITDKFIVTRNFKTGKFLKGSTPFNKGVPRSEWMDEKKEKKVMEIGLKNLKPNYNIGGLYNKRKVVAIKNRKLCGVFISMSEAERKTGINRVRISKVCNKKQGFNTAGGYKWFFESDNSWTTLIDIQ